MAPTTQLTWYGRQLKKTPILLIHNTWNTPRSFKKHIELFNNLDHPVVTFHLKKAQPRDRKNLTKWIFSYPKISTVWNTQVYEVMSQLEHPFIIAAFSCPALSVFYNSHKFRNSIRAVICDGGPFANMVACTHRLLLTFFKDKPRYLIQLFAWLSPLQFPKSVYKKVRYNLEQWPENIPILSIRGLNDPLVRSADIEGVFEKNLNLPIEILNIKSGEHLDGLRNHENLYSKTIKNFLSNL